MAGTTWNGSGVSTTDHALPATATEGEWREPDDGRAMPFALHLWADIVAHVPPERRPTSRWAWFWLGLVVTARSPGFHAAMLYRLAHAARGRFGLSGKALALSLVLWREAGRHHRRTVKLCLGHVGLGVSEYAARRALRALEAAGLVTILRKPGRGLEVTLLDRPAEE